MPRSAGYYTLAKVVDVQTDKKHVKISWTDGDQQYEKKVEVSQLGKFKPEYEVRRK